MTDPAEALAEIERQIRNLADIVWEAGEILAAFSPAAELADWLTKKLGGVTEESETPVTLPTIVSGWGRRK